MLDGACEIVGENLECMQSSKEELFRLVRREQVTLWAGAGISISAGFPSGNKLKELLFETLTPQEQAVLNLRDPLPTFAEEFCQIRNYDLVDLVHILSAIFAGIAPKTSLAHDLVASIPHFDSIITTNYDDLFERSLRDSGQVILADHDIPIIDPNKVQVFKVHGDFSDPRTIILRSSDYVRFFSGNSQDSIYWNVVKERMATKSICFLGYSLEDINARAVFESITKALGGKARDCFFISPKQPEHKIKDLEKRGLKYIDMDAESFLTELSLNIKEHVVADFEDGGVGSETLRKVLYSNNLFPSLDSIGSKYTLTGVRSSNGEIRGDLSFTIQPNHEQLREEYKKFLSGEKFGKLEILRDQVSSIRFAASGLRLMDKERLGKLTLESRPILDDFIDLVFDDGFEAMKTPVKVFVSKLKLQVDLHLYGSILRFSGSPDVFKGGSHHVTVEYEHTDICESVSTEIHFFSLLSRISSGDNFKIYHDGALKLSPQLGQIQDFRDHAELFFNHFKDLKEIENLKGVRFNRFPFQEVSREKIDQVRKIVRGLRGEMLVEPMPGEYIFEFDRQHKKNTSLLKVLNGSDDSASVQLSGDETITVYGQSFFVGRRVIDIQQAYIKNLDDILQKRTKKVQLASKSKSMHVSYRLTT